ncbi:hypothetical protein [Streptomyces sp. NPDC050485]|uniref:hypothetical protein n=1 Tax=Streptomyces sp. NPDC050485 TaxID=3365617 RepID=UPI0037925AD3
MTQADHAQAWGRSLDGPLWGTRQRRDEHQPFCLPNGWMLASGTAGGFVASPPWFIEKRVRAAQAGEWKNPPPVVVRLQAKVYGSTWEDLITNVDAWRDQYYAAVFGVDARGVA